MKKIRLKNQQELLLVEATKEDAAQLIEYVKKVADETNFLTFSSDEFNKTIEEEENIIEQHRKSKNQIFVLAKLNDEIIGIFNVGASHKKRLKHIGEFGISVLKEHWNIGVGNALMNYLVNWANENPVIRKISLQVSIENKSAIKLYQKYGFEIEGLIRRDLLVDGEFKDGYQMGLLID